MASISITPSISVSNRVYIMDLIFLQTKKASKRNYFALDLLRLGFIFQCYYIRQQIMYPLKGDNYSPIKLLPCSEAKTHQLSYRQYRQNQQLKNRESDKEVQLLSQIHKLSHFIESSKHQHLQQIQERGNNILMLSMEIQRLRQIIHRYDDQLQESQKNRSQMQMMYEMKIEKIKEEMMKEIAEKIQEHKQNCYDDLEQISKIHSDKIKQLLQTQFSNEEETKLYSMEVNQKNIKINILEARLSERQHKIDKLTYQMEEKQKIIYHKDEQNRQLGMKLQILEKDREDNLQNINKKLSEMRILNSELNVELECCRQNRVGVEDHNKQLRNQVVQIKNEMENVVKRNNILQKQLIEMNRKTFKNKEDKDINRDRQIGNEERETQKERQANIKQNVQALYKGNAENIKRIGELQSIIDDFEIKVKQYESTINHLNHKMTSFMNTHDQNPLVEELKMRNREMEIQFKTKIHNLQQIVASFGDEQKYKSKDIEFLYNKIEQQYLEEIQHLKKENEEIQTSTALMLENMAKQKKEEEIGKKKK